MSISVTEPVSKAFNRTSLICFKPFDIGKWFGLGFCAWLAFFGEGGGASFNVNTGSSRTGGIPQPVQDALNWMQANMALTVLIIFGVFLFFFLLGQIFIWLQSRGTFMFLDGIVHNRGLIVQP